MTEILNPSTNKTGIRESVVTDISGNDLLKDILNELKIMNQYLSVMTDETIGG